MKAAFITGVTGQDGSYLAELLLDKKYSVYGLVRYCSEKKHSRIGHLKDLHLIEGDMTDTSRLNSIINSFEKYVSIEVYNLAAMSHVKHSFNQPVYSTDVDALGTLRLLEAIRQTHFSSKFKFYQAGTSEMFGKIQDPIQDEMTPFYPRSPYGVAKVYAYWITKNYREAHGLFACTGILFNHESERRGEEFVTRKITLGLERWLRTGEPIRLGNLNASRDWGHAEDYVEAMWRMLQVDHADEFVIGTGESHTVREFVTEALKCLTNEPFVWSGTDQSEQLILNGKPVVVIDPEFYRLSEVDALISNPKKACEVLGWRPKISFHELVKRMVQNDCNGVALCGSDETCRDRTSDL